MLEVLLAASRVDDDVQLLSSHLCTAPKAWQAVMQRVSPSFRPGGFTEGAGFPLTRVMTVSSMMPPFSLVKQLSDPVPSLSPAMSPTTSDSVNAIASLPWRDMVMQRGWRSHGTCPNDCRELGAGLQVSPHLPICIPIGMRGALRM